LGVDANAVLAAAGIDRRLLVDPNARLPATTMAALWEAAVERTGDPAFGLRASRYVRPTTFHALGYAVFASANLRDALLRLVRYSRLVSDAMSLELRTTDETATLSLVPVSQHVPESPAALDAVMSLIVRTARTLTDRSLTFVRVEQRRLPPADQTPYARFFRCPVHFGAALDSMTIESFVLDRPFLTANPELARHNDDLAQRYLAQMAQRTLVERVHAVLIEQLTGTVSPATVAASLGMSSRSLQRRLKDVGTSYATLLDETRRDLACSYLRRETYSITEIAFLLGFDDSSAFARAFRRWIGKTPSAFRAEARREAEWPFERAL
jgi:AraC-like DNA-binding protein